MLKHTLDGSPDMPNDACSHVNLRGSTFGGINYHSSLEVFLSSAIGNYYSGYFSL